MASGDPGLPEAPLLIVNSKAFRRDAKRMRKRGADLARLGEVISALRTHQDLEPRHRDHLLTGNWKGSRECHIAPDWLLIYQRDHASLRLLRTGTHSDLFDN